MTHKIDEAGFRAARKHAEAIDWMDECAPDAEREDGDRQLREIIAAYLAALPKQEPGRDRIAVVVNVGCGGTADVMPAGPAAFDWEQLECAAEEFGCEGPFARNIVRCTLRTPRPAEPVEVSGGVEEVG